MVRILILTALFSSFAQAAVARYRFTTPNLCLRIEFLQDNLVHFEYSAKLPCADTLTAIDVSPMVYKKDYPGPRTSSQTGAVLQTPAVRVAVNPTNLCFQTTDLRTGEALTTLCPDKLNQDWKELAIEPGNTRHIYGIGQHFKNPGTADGDWMGEVYEPTEQGNGMRWISGGGPSVAQFPIMYALGDGTQNYALFLDQIHKLRWDFKQNWWRVGMWGNRIAGYVIAGENLQQLHKEYMDLTGHPPVAPKPMLGLWMSEFGYTSWDELDGVLASLRANQFPTDGAFLDIQWFGLQFGADVNRSTMGTLRFDGRAFPNAERKIAELRNQGIRLGLIQEPYVSEVLPEHRELARRGFMAQDRFGQPIRLAHNPWWGIGGILDFTNPGTGDYWFDQKTLPLIRMGALVEWTDLTEPEMYDSNNSIYFEGRRHADIHNIYALSMAGSIFRGYERNRLDQRPFVMSRSGTCGIHRYGTGMWSGDVGANMGSFTAHYNAQMHMSLNGISYYSSDIGGFHNTQDGSRDERYTQWLGAAALIDIPIRPHSWNLQKNLPTAPDRVGFKESNLENIRLRYRLAPYYYSLMHQAYREGTPIIPPLVYYFQTDNTVRRIGSQKMIGPSLMMALVAQYGQTERGLYLPKGKWIDFYTNEWHDSRGQTISGHPLYLDGRFRAPLFARSGAILPMTQVDGQTRNMLGLRSDRVADDLIVRVYEGSSPSQFTLYEDDGMTTAYLSGKVRTTTLSEIPLGNTVEVTIDRAGGDFDMTKQRDNWIEFIAEGKEANAVSLNGVGLPKFDSLAILSSQTRGFVNAGRNVVIVKSGPLGVQTKKLFQIQLFSKGFNRTSVYFTCREGRTNHGTSVYAVGNIPELGNWNPRNALTQSRLEPFPYPHWNRAIDVPANTRIEWKCAKINQSTGEIVEWERNDNHVIHTGTRVYSGVSAGGF